MDIPTGNRWIDAARRKQNTGDKIRINAFIPYTFRSKFDTSKTLLSGKPNSLKKKGKLIETGRVEKGEQSNQTFTNSYEQFYYHTSHTIKFKIQPASTKNINGIVKIIFR